VIFGNLDIFDFSPLGAPGLPSVLATVSFRSPGLLVSGGWVCLCVLLLFSITSLDLLSVLFKGDFSLVPSSKILHVYSLPSPVDKCPFKNFFLFLLFDIFSFRPLQIALPFYYYSSGAKPPPPPPPPSSQRPFP